MKKMFVYKRNGKKTPVRFDEILKRIDHLTQYPFPLDGIDSGELTQEVISQIKSGMTTSEIDIFTAQKSASKILKHPNYETLAMRTLVDNHHKNTLPSLPTFSHKMRVLQNRVIDGEVRPALDEDFYKFVMDHADDLDSLINYDRDFDLDYFGFCTLYDQSYLLKDIDTVIESPQDMFLRVSTFIHFSNDEPYESVLGNIAETYECMSLKRIIHASPTLFNSGLRKAGCVSCFLGASDDSKEGIQRINTECTNTSAACGGIAFSASFWRSKGEFISGSGGRTRGIIPFIKWAQAGVDSFDQGSRRKGSLAVYLHVHHPDLLDFLKLRVHGGDETQRSRDTFIALWLSDIFMRRVKAGGMWSFFDPHEHPDLLEIYGEEYTRRYEQLEAEGKFKSQLPAREVWKSIYDTKRDSGLPYMMAGDRINTTSNHCHLGPITTSNLCTEIVQYCENKDASPETSETACCVLASVALPKCVEDGDRISDEFPQRPVFNYNKLIEVVSIAVRNLNKVIDKTYYPSEATRRGATNHRAIGVGVQGLADVFHKFKIPYESEKARELNKRIFETIYYSALSESSKLARLKYLQLKDSCGGQLPKTAGAYPTFLKNGGCPLSKGILNFELQGLQTSDLLQKFDWESLRSHVVKFGVRNSMFVALMPTQSTSQMFRNTEYTEPAPSNIYLRKVMSGEYFIVSRALIHALELIGIPWSTELADHLKDSNGSVANIDGPSEEFKNRFKTIWEINQKSIITMSADRGPFIDQSQSMNLYFDELTLDKFTQSHFYGWTQGLKTLSYYIRQRPATRSVQMTFKHKVVEPARAEVKVESEEEFGCTVCGT